MEAPTSDTNNMITDSPIVERERTHLNDQQSALLKELLRPGSSIEAAIPADATPEELWGALDACVRGLGMLEARINRLTPIIGRILMTFENKPSLYKDLGYDTYSDFMNRGVYALTGLHRSSAYIGKLAAREWPQLTPDRYVEIGPKKLEILSKFTNGNNSNAEMWLDTAKRSKSVTEFREYVETRGLLAPGEAVGATLMITTNRDRYKLFKAFFADGRIQSTVGSKSPDEILAAMIQEVYEDWIERHEEERARKATCT